VGTDPAVLEVLMTELPSTCSLERDYQGKIPLHYLCQRRSFSVLVLLDVLLQAAPNIILVRDGDGSLPAILAHNASAPPTVVQYLLRRQIQAHKGVVLSHADLCHLRWNESIFLEYVAVALQQTLSNKQHEVHRISLDDCQFEYPTWQLLQKALEKISVATLTELRLVDLHIWQSTLLNTNESWRVHRERVTSDVNFWQQMVERHRSTLKRIELPHFYALTTETANRVAQHLAQQELPCLETLDVRTLLHYGALSSSLFDTGSANKAPVQQVEVDVDYLVKGITPPLCSLKSLSLETLTVKGFQKLLAGLRNNRSIMYFHVAKVVPDTKYDQEDNTFASNVTTSADEILWDSVRHNLAETLRNNTTLESVLGPCHLIQCPRVQHFLHLNRKFHLRDLGHWPPSLMPHVLAKTKEDIRAKADQSHDNYDNKSNDNGIGTIGRNNSPYFFITSKLLDADHHDPRSTIFYILKSRPDIALSKQ